MPDFYDTPNGELANWTQRTAAAISAAWFAVSAGFENVVATAGSAIGAVFEVFADSRNSSASQRGAYNDFNASEDKSWKQAAKEDKQMASELWTYAKTGKFPEAPEVKAAAAKDNDNNYDPPSESRSISRR